MSVDKTCRLVKIKWSPVPLESNFGNFEPCWFTNCSLDNSFIHSFNHWIYIALFQEIYSEALSSQPRQIWVAYSTEGRQLGVLLLDSSNISTWSAFQTRAWPIHRQHSPSGPIVGQSEPSEPSANDDNRWPVCADVSRWCYSLNSPSRGLYRPPVQNYSRFHAASFFDDC